MSDLSGLNPTPHAIAVYASRPLSPGVTQHSLPSGRCPLLGPVFHRLDRTSLPGALIRSARRGPCAQKVYILHKKPSLSGTLCAKPHKGEGSTPSARRKCAYV